LLKTLPSSLAPNMGFAETFFITSFQENLVTSTFFFACFEVCLNSKIFLTSSMH
jgi:hypothetical protein